MAKKSEDDKVFDVAKPGEGKTEIGSKPMIVGHKSMAADPMMKDDPSSDETDKIEEKISQTSKVKIEPVSEDMKSSDNKNSDAIDEPKNDKDAADSSTSDDIERDRSAKADAKSPKPSDDTTIEKDEQDSGEKSEDRKVGDEAGKELDPAAIEMERQENLRKIIDSKKYYLNIKESSSTSKSAKLFGIIALIFVLLGGLFYLVDTKTIDFGVDLPFSIFGKDDTENIDNADTLPTEQQPVPENSSETDSSEVETNQTSVDVPAEYSMDVPDEWQFTRKLTEINGESKFTDTYVMPSGTELIVDSVTGGAGGECQPDEGDVPHQAGNNCPTLEILSRDKLEVSSTTQSQLFEGYNLYIVSKRHTDIEGRSIYALCLNSVEESTKLELNEPFMGFAKPACRGVAKRGYVTTINGIDNSSPTYFEHEDVLAIRQAFLTFVLL